MNKPTFGAFITFEGGEGAGKTTLIRRLAETLQQEEISFLCTREPGGSQLSETVRGWLLNHDEQLKIGSLAELLLFLAARAQHLEEMIVPALQQGHMVLCDRFNDSTIVYQGIARRLGKNYVEQLCQLVSQAYTPVRTYYLDVDPAVGLKRTRFAQKDNAKEGQVDRIEAETLDFHLNVRAGFLTLAQEQPSRICVIDANQDPDTVYHAVISDLRQTLGL